jgi:hypothetical protein
VQIAAWDRHAVASSHDMPITGRQIILVSASLVAEVCLVVGFTIALTRRTVGRSKGRRDRAYEIFQKKEDGAFKILLTP